MFSKSIRWRIQMWHSALLCALVATLTVGFYIYEARARRQIIDGRLRDYLTPLLPRVGRPGEGRGPGGRPLLRDRPPPPRDGGRPPGPPEGREGEGRRGGMPEQPNDRLDDFMRREAQFIYHVVWNREGRLSLKSTNAPSFVPPPDPEDPAQPFYRTREDVRELLHLVPSGGVVLVGTTIAPMNAELERLALRLAAAGLLIVVLGIAGGWWLAHRALRPIAQISAAAEAIAGGDLSQRISVEETESELGELVGILNRTFDRLEKNFEREVHFTADASHELRTPIAVMLAETQRALLRDRTAEEYRQALLVCERSGERMRALVNSLLELARLDSGELRLNREDCDLARIGREALEFIAPLASQKQVTLRATLAPVMARVDVLRLGQVFNNLLTNALIHNPEGIEVSLELRAEAGWAVFTLADQGQGIAPDAMPKIFDRFSRVDPARARAQGGSGLGLSISKAIVEAHGGTIEVRSRLGQGTTFVVQLPLGSV